MTTRSRNRRSVEQWRELMAAYERGGKSQKEFCREAGVSGSSFWKWRNRLQGEAVPTFVELESIADSGGDVSARVEVEFAGGIKLRIWSE